MVFSVALAIAAVAMAPLMTNVAYADNNAYASTKLTNCNITKNFKTFVDQVSEGDDVKTTISVPSTACGYALDKATIEVTDGNKKKCTFTTTASNGSDTDSCGGTMDIGETTILMQVSLDYKDSNGNYYTVNYSQTDSTT